MTRLYRHSRAIFILFAGLAVLSLWGVTRLEFVFELERFFPSDDEDMAALEQFKSDFEDDDNFLLIALDAEGSLFDTAYLMRIRRLTNSLELAPNVIRVQSLTNTPRFMKSSLGMMIQTTLVAPERYPERRHADSLYVMQDDMLRGRMISQDGRSSIIHVTTIDRMQQAESKELMQYVDNLLAGMDEDSYHILGRARFQTSLVRQQIKEFTLSTLASIVLVTMVFWFFLRRVLAVMIAVLSISVAMLVFIGLIGWLGISLDILSMMLPVILIIVCVSDIVHLMIKYRDECIRGLAKEEALKKTVREIGLATLLTSVTTAVGFLTLATSAVYPVRLLGLTAAMGVVVAYIVIIVLTPALLYRVEVSKLLLRKEAKLRFLDRLLARIYRVVWTHGVGVSVCMLFLFIFSIFGVSRVSTDVNVYGGLPSGLKVTEDFAYFESTFAGFRPYEIVLQAPDGISVYAPSMIDVARRLQQQLMSSDLIESTFSIVQLIHRVARPDQPSGQLTQVIPPADIRRARRQFARIDSSVLAAMVNEDERRLRISSTIKDAGSDVIAAYTDSLQSWMDEALGDEVEGILITGTGLILDKNNHLLRRNIFEGLSIGFVIIALMMALLFRDIRLILISLLPNVFPLLVAGACMGYMGIPMDAPTSIIFAISFGIAVDDTIHFLSKVKIDLSDGRPLEEAIHNAVTETGKAIVITSIILIVGFLILMISATQGIRSVGILTSVTMVSAVLADLVLLPVLLRWWMASGR